jgi:hypothetical protein
MKRAIALAVLTAGLGASALGQQPQIQNGRVETRPGASIEREVTSLAGGASATDPIWVGWRVPMVDGERNLCCSYYNSDFGSYSGIRGCQVDSSPTSSSGMPQIAPPTGPVALEGGTGLVVLLRLVDKKVERLRRLGDDCPLDAGGRTVYWLTNVTPADSLTYIRSLVHPDGLAVDSARNLSSAAVQAIGLHRDVAADAILDQLATGDGDSTVRRLAASSLGSYRGAHGFEMLRKLIGSETLAENRRQLVSALGQTRQPQTAEVLLALARKDDDSRVRAEAIYWVPLRGGQRVVNEVLAIVENDTNDSVRTRAIDGLAQLSKDEAVPLLIQIARTTKNAAVRKQAVSRLGDSRDPRALAFLEDIIRR